MAFWVVLAGYAALIALGAWYSTRQQRLLREEYQRGYRAALEANRPSGESP